MAPEFLAPGFLDWKFFRDRPGWYGSRSFVLRQEGGVVAHACIWPAAFHGPKGIVGCCHIVDWAASPGAAGAGVAIYRELMQMADTAIVIGGSHQARRLLPKLGFKPYGVLRYFVRVIRPLAQFLARPKESAGRKAMRLARNSIWAMPPLQDAGLQWFAEHRERASEWLDNLVGEPFCGSSLPGVRSSALLNYMLDCPAAHCHLYSVTSHRQTCGYFVLNEVRGQTRIVELFVRSADTASWEAACRLALWAAADLPRTCEVVAASSLGWLDEVFRRCGMRERGERPVLVYDPRGLLADRPPLHLQMTDSDAYFLNSPSDPFLT